MSKGTCSIDGCKRNAYCRKMCRSHYESEMGFVQVRPKAKYACIDCGVEYERQIRDARGEPRCHPCACKYGWSLREPAPVYESSSVVVGLVCAHCESIFTARHRASKFCSERCGKESAAIRLGYRNRSCGQCGALLGYRSTSQLCAECRLTNLAARRKVARAGRDSSDRNHRHRARKFGGKHESVNRSKVFERDGWMCGICKESIFKSVKYPDLMSVSLDHIVPLSRGGGHLYSNVQASHLGCNITKGADLEALVTI